MNGFRPLHAALLLIAAAAIAGPVWAVFFYDPTPAYQALAESSCKCARLKSDTASKEACWRDFDAITENSRANAEADACFPLSQVVTGVPRGPGITLYWGIVETDEKFCTKEEAVAGEALFNQIQEALASNKDPEAPDHSMAALVQLARAYARGKPVTLAKSQGCVSGYDQNTPG